MTDVLKKVPRRHRVFGIPKRLRVYFMHDRSLLGKPGACAWNTVSAFLKSAVSPDGAAKVVYRSKDGKTEQTFDAIDWLARIAVHIPNIYEVDPLRCPNC